ncbi:terminase small subunit [uncultured Amphritea sp.]|uniref:terminase small subunit n=1 Tax=uncultured Amphritea sp. TaxID=981605 RepID=UPI002624D29B|nr:terminase small subunit [uncultured Amphritea sp.]
MAKDKLTDKEERFAQAILTTDSATEAYESAFNCSRMKRTTITRNAAALKDKPRVAARIAELKIARSERTAIDADYVLNRMVDIDQMDILDILTNDGGFKPIFEWPKVWRTYISGIDLAELYEGQGDDRRMIGVLKKMKWPDKIKNLENIGRHVKVQAFKDKLDVNVEFKTLSELLAAAAEE